MILEGIMPMKIYLCADFILTLYIPKASKKQKKAGLLTHLLSATFPLNWQWSLRMHRVIINSQLRV